MILKLTVLLVCIAVATAVITDESGNPIHSPMSNAHPKLIKTTLRPGGFAVPVNLKDLEEFSNTPSPIPDYLKEMEQPMLKTAAILRKSLALIEDGYKQTFKRDMPETSYDDSTEFPRNLANLAYWQVVRTEEGFDEGTVNANRGEKELLKIAKYLSGAH